MINKEYYLNITTTVGLIIVIIVAFCLIFRKFEESLSAEYQYYNQGELKIYNKKLMSLSQI